MAKSTPNALPSFASAGSHPCSRINFLYGVTEAVAVSSRVCRVRMRASVAMRLSSARAGVGGSARKTVRAYSR